MPLAAYAGCLACYAASWVSGGKWPIVVLQLCALAAFVLALRLLPPQPRWIGYLALGVIAAASLSGLLLASVDVPWMQPVLSAFPPGFETVPILLFFGLLPLTVILVISSSLLAYLGARART